MREKSERWQEVKRVCVSGSVGCFDARKFGEVSEPGHGV